MSLFQPRPPYLQAQKVETKKTHFLTGLSFAPSLLLLQASYPVLTQAARSTCLLLQGDILSFTRCPSTTKSAKQKKQSRESTVLSRNGSPLPPPTPNSFVPALPTNKRVPLHDLEMQECWGTHQQLH